MKKRIINKIFQKKHFIPAIIFLVVFNVIVFFQNCAPMGEPIAGVSSSEVLGPQDTANLCQYTSNKAPKVERIHLRVNGQDQPENLVTSKSPITIKVGMGTNAGSDGTVELSVYAQTSIDRDEMNDQTLDRLDCNRVSADGFRFNCSNNFSDQGSGLFRSRVRIIQDDECLSGAKTFNVEVRDSVLNCPGLAKRSTPVTININAVDTCLPTQTHHPKTPFDLGGLGTKVAINGSYAVATAPGDDSKANNAGAAYVYRNVNGIWTYQTILTAADAMSGDSLTGVAIEGNTIVLGTSGHNNDMGAVYIFQGSGSNWNEVKKLTPDAVSGKAYFGFDVDISNSRIVAGAFGENNFKGAIYIFSGIGWNTKTKFTPPVAQNNDRFGWSVDLDNSDLAVGAPSLLGNRDRAYIVNVSNMSLAQSFIWDSEGGEFGFDVGLNNGILAVGAPTTDADRQFKSGATFIFSKDNGIWNQDSVFALRPNDAASEDYFGYSVTVSDKYIIAGAPRQDQKTGSAYLFDLNGKEIFKIRSRKADRDSEDQFGSFVSENGNNILMVGAPNDESKSGTFAESSGGIYFVRLP